MQEYQIRMKHYRNSLPIMLHSNSDQYPFIVGQHPNCVMA